MDRHIRIRNRIIGQIETILAFARKIEGNTIEHAIKPRLADLIKLHDDFNEREIALEEFEEYQPVTSKIDAMYYEARTLLEDAVFQRTGVNANNNKTGEELNETLEMFVTQQKSFYETLNATAAVKLPKINVESFSGDYKMWPSFRDLYVNAIHNHPNLKESQKLQQLKSLLRGEAAGLIRHITTTDQNYDEAWAKLEARYNKPKPIISSLIQTFMDQKPCKTTNYKDLRRLYDQSDEVIRAFKSLGKEDQSRDPWLIYMLLHKVDVDTRQLWARESVNNLHPTFSEFLTFLNIRCDTLESCIIQDKRSFPSQVSKAFMVEQSSAATSKLTCYACKGDHLLFKCPSFRNSSLEDRIQLVNEQRLCHNCLKKGHFASKCYSKTSCLICKRRHHSLIHQQANTDSNHTIAHSVFVDQPNVNIQSTSSQQSTSTPQSTSTQQSTSNQQSTSPSPQHLHSTKGQNTTLFAKSVALDQQLMTEHTPTQNSLPSSKDNIQSSTCILLPTAIVNVRSRSGEFVQARVLLDSGSQCAFVTESLIKRLGLRRSKSNMKIIGLASLAVGSTRGRTTLLVQSTWDSNYTIIITSQIIKSISSNLPETSFSIQSCKHLEEIELADPKFNEARPTDILIGAEHFFEIVGNKRMDITGLPPLWNSHFGWLIAGSMEFDQKDYNASLMVQTLKVENEDLNELLKKFWEVEEPSSINIAEHDDYCEKLYSSSTVKMNNNRFIVKLPFRTPRLVLGNSYTNAKNRLLAMERKFKKNYEFKRQYVEFMQEYEQLNHMKRVDWLQIPSEGDKRNFLPHHGVYKESSITTKLRVVFDASSKTVTSVALNDILHVGPKIQNDLFTILLRFRLHQFVFVADIEKMYRQILVNQDDCNYQLILWRENESQPISIYKLLTITYGVNCSPYLAVRTLQQMARETISDSPNASNAILNDFYIDDLLSGADSEEAAIHLKDEIISALGRHGCHLRKWRSNSEQLLKSFQQDEVTTNFKLIEENPSVTTLGILWNASTDIFSFQTNLSPIRDWTKRSILSEISKIYDPFGWLAPTVILFKIMIQRLWVAHLDWDTPLPIELNEEFQSMYQGLTCLDTIEIQRGYHKFAQSKLKNIQLHAFCDASEKAYGAVVYLRATGIDDSITTQIICSKGKVTPIKQICLPRLELCGAYILAKLVKLIKECLFKEVPIEVYAWCDSSIVLHWLADIPRRWKTFIANRTSYILDVIPTQQWRYVRSKENPADLITRGVLPERHKIKQMNQWWKGPLWLDQQSSRWPVHQILVKKFVNSTNLELKANTLVCTNLQQLSILDNLIQACSSYSKIKRSLVYVLRFGRVSKEGKTIVHGPIQINELVKAENLIFRIIQAQEFSEELTSLSRKGEIKSSSRLKSLDIFIDDHGVLRVGGRLKNSVLKYSAQHPIILPKRHPINFLIIKEIHHSLLHGGLSLMLNSLRLKFWMIDVRNSVKSFIKTCVTCARFRAIPGCPKMGDLPAERVTEHRAFLNSGLDYAGPIYIKTSKLRKAPMSKAYIAVFVCLAVKAVHLEVVSSLDTESFIAALRRFIARRGLPALIWCDNGSNLVSGNSELKLLHKQLKQQQGSNNVLDFCSQRTIEFRFSPPSGPHFGGLWEATVRSAKFHLKRDTRNCHLTFEELTTMMTQIEAVLNSRPLCRVHDDVDELQILTPGHFLIGEPMISFPEPNYEHIQDNKLNIWQHIQKRVQGFWKNWHKDYLSTLTQRMKWTKDGPKFEIGDVVLLKDENLPPAKWMLGRIMTVYPGKDNITRVVKIKTTQSELIRPAVKLVKLPIRNNNVCTIPKMIKP